MRDGIDRLLDIQEAIKEIERYAVRGRDAFLQDENSGIGVGRWIYLAGALVGLVATASQFLIIAEMTKEVASSEAK